MGYRIAHADFAAQPAEMGDHALYQLVGAAARPPHAAVLLQLVDQRIDRAGGHRVAADQQRMEAESLAQLFVLHEAGNHRIDRTPCLIAGKGGGGLDHAGKVEERHCPKLDVAFFEHTGRIFEKIVVARNVGRVELGDLGLEACVIIRIIEVGAVGPVEAVEWHDRHEVDIVGHAVTLERPQLLQARRVGDDRWPRVEGEAVFFPDIGTPARLVARFDQRCLHAARLQSDGKGKPAKSSADYTSTLHARFPASERGFGLLPRPVSTPIALPIGTGGLPISILALSSVVSRPA